jgi:hypothetical protein
VFRFARGLGLLQDGEVLLDGPVDALLVEREELELFRFEAEDARGGQGGVDLCVTGLVVIGQELATLFVEAESEKFGAVYFRTRPRLPGVLLRRAASKGYRFAVASFSACSSSRAHGCWYWANGIESWLCSAHYQRY